jgi:hypothetical protein
MPKRSRFEMELHRREFAALILGAAAALGAAAPADAQSDPCRRGTPGRPGTRSSRSSARRLSRRAQISSRWNSASQPSIRTARSGSSIFGGGARPFGFDIAPDGELRRLVPNAAETAVIERMQAMRLDGVTFRAIGAATGHPYKSVQRILGRVERTCLSLQKSAFFGSAATRRGWWIGYGRIELIPTTCLKLNRPVRHPEPLGPVDTGNLPEFVLYCLDRTP